MCQLFNHASMCIASTLGLVKIRVSHCQSPMESNLPRSAGMPAVSHLHSRRFYQQSNIQNYACRAQVREERALGLLPEPHMEAESHVIMCSLEASFIEAVALPMWEHLAACFPSLTPAVLRMELNHNLYHALSRLPDNQADEVR